MYLLPVYNYECTELIIIDTKNNLKKFMVDYINDILDYDCGGCFAPAVISFYDYLYYIPDENELDNDKIEDSNFVTNYQCISDEDTIKYIENKYKRIKYSYDINVNIDIESKDL